MNFKKYSIAIGLFLLSFNGFSQSKKIIGRQSQGICGTVVSKSGNQMPSPDMPASKGQTVERQVLIYELTNVSQVESREGFYRNPKSRLVKTTRSKKDGTFCVALRPGRYSVFVKEAKGLYANQFDDANNIFPVLVLRHSWQKINFEINHAATY